MLGKPTEAIQSGVLHAVIKSPGGRMLGKPVEAKIGGQDVRCTQPTTCRRSVCKERGRIVRYVGGTFRPDGRTGCSLHTADNMSALHMAILVF